MMRNILLTLALLGLSLSAQAWREGNGGDGVKIGDKIYLLDLVEAGSEQLKVNVPQFDHSFITTEVKAISKTLSEPIPEKMVISKLGEIYQKNQVLALTILSAMKQLSWRWVTFPLKDLKDEGNKLDIPRELLVQLALRVNQTVQIHKGSWDLLDDRNKTALLFHEIIYALMTPERSKDGMDMNSPRVRALVGFLFSKNFQNERMDLILTTEAPHLVFPTTLNMKLQPIWGYKKESVLINQRWNVSMRMGSNQMVESHAFGSSKMTAWLKQKCQDAVSARSSFLLGLQADVLKLDFHSRGLGDEEEFFLSPVFTWEAPLLVLEIANTTSLEACQAEAKSALNLIISKTVH